MDSITQIVLGAAVGEATLGKKIGNRAMLWGAIAGTIPDLDVISNAWLTELEGLATHRGITHSIFFAILCGPILAWIVHYMYESKYHRKVALVVRSTFLLFASAGFIYLGSQAEVTGQIILSLMGVAILSGSYLFCKRRYFTQPIEKPSASFREWTVLFFLAFLTHTLLDCCTVYGTQLFAPFSDHRVSWNNISVADPSYTLPFLLCLIAASFFKRTNVWRSRLNWAGIIISSLYMCFTVFNQQRVKGIFKQNLEQQGIEVNRSMVTPTILNNILWYCVAETDSNLVFGRHSFFDPSDEMILKFLSKNDSLILGFENDHTIETLKWFSDDYYTIGKLPSGNLVFSDMRYGPFDFKDYKNPENFIFKFELEEREEGLEMLNEQGGPPEDSEEDFIKFLWERVMGDTSNDK